MTLDNRRRWIALVVLCLFAVAAAVLGTLLRPQPMPAHAGAEPTGQPATAEAD